MIVSAAYENFQEKSVFFLFPDCQHTSRYAAYVRLM